MGIKLQDMGLFEWQKIMRRCVFPMSSTKGFGYLLSTYADTRTGTRINPGRARIAREYGITERQATKHLDALQRYGMIVCEVQGNSFGRGGKGLAARYRLTAPAELVEIADRSDDDVMLVLADIIPELGNSGSPVSAEVENYSAELGNFCAEVENSSAERGELQFPPSPQGSPQRDLLNRSTQATSIDGELIESEKPWGQPASGGWGELWGVPRTAPTRETARCNECRRDVPRDELHHVADVWGLICQGCISANDWATTWA